MSQEQIPYFNLEKKKDPRGHLLVPDQWKWGGLWLGIAFVMLLAPILPIKLLAIPALLILIGGGYKYEDGVGFRIVQTILRSKRMRRKSNGKIEIKKTKTPPIGLRTLGFPTTFDDVPIPEEILAKLDDETIERVRRESAQEVFELGAIYSKQENSDTAFVVGTGMDSASLDSSELFDSRRRVVNAIRNVALASNVYPSFSFIYSTRPINIQPNLMWTAQNLDPEVEASGILDVDKDEVAFLAATVEERQSTAIKEVQALATVDAQEVTMATSITLPRPKSWPRRKDGTLDGLLTSKQLRKAPIMNLTLLLEQELADAGVSDAAALSLEDVNRFVRMGWDIKGIQDWYENVAEQALMEADFLYNKNTQLTKDDVPPQPSHWPENEIVASNSKVNESTYLSIDGSCHRTLETRRFGNERVFAHDFFELFRSNDIQPSWLSGLTISECGDIVSVTDESRALRRKIVFQEGLSQTRKGERYKGAAEREKEDKWRRKQDSLYYGGALAFSFNVFITISAASPEILDEIEEVVKTHARRLQIELRPIKWEARQLRAFASANFGVSKATQ